MASAALCKIYGKQGYTAPNILSVEYIDSNHIRVNLEGGHHVWPIGGHGDGFQVEDTEGLINCTTAISNYQDNCIIMTTEREFHLPAKFHALWKCIPPQFVPKDINGMPLLSCYGMEIKQ